VYTRELPKAERLALLASVALGLTDEDEPRPDLRALTEGTVAAIFADVLSLVEVEIELQEEATASGPSGRVRLRPLRQMVLTVADRVVIDRGPLRADSGGDALVECSDLIEELRDRILGDNRANLVGDAFLDLDSVVGDDLKEQLGKADNYFSAVPIEPTRAGLEDIRASLRRMGRRPCGEAMLSWGPDTKFPGPDHICVAEDCLVN
jgi:hypothetical protein